jgi:hypothetical protein
MGIKQECLRCLESVFFRHVVHDATEAHTLAAVEPRDRSSVAVPCFFVFGVLGIHRGKTVLGGRAIKNARPALVEHRKDGRDEKGASRRNFDLLIATRQTKDNANIMPSQHEVMKVPNVIGQHLSKVLTLARLILPV